MRKVTFVSDRGCNIQYLDLILRDLHKHHRIDLHHVDLSDYRGEAQALHAETDCLIYQTFPHQFHPEKYDAALIAETDESFQAFEGTKLLFDAHDSGSVDGFSRFEDDGLPRIKSTPSYEFLRHYNVVAATTQGFLRDWRYRRYVRARPPEVKKKVPLSYCVSYGYDAEFADQGAVKELVQQDIRGAVRDVLNAYPGEKVDTSWKRNYFRHLKRVLISVCVPGWGEATFRHLESLMTGSLMLAHESIRGIKLLPHADLVEGRDYVAFNLSNLDETLDQLFADSERVHAVRKSGRETFFEGFDFGKSARVIEEVVHASPQDLRARWLETKSERPVD